MPRPVFALLVALVLSACGGSSSNSSDPVATARAQTYQRISQLRATVSLPPLATWTASEACAGNEAQLDAQAGIAHNTFGQCGESAQNECVNWSSPSAIPADCLQSMWNEGPGSDPATHGDYMNLTNASYTKVAVAIYVTPTNSVWAVMNFAP
jgi:hypothetical protein